MADDSPERWTIGRRTGRVAAISAVLVPLALLAGVVAAGWYYDRAVRPETKRPVKTFPAPGVETYIHPGALDPHAAAPQPRPDPTVAAAKRAVTHDGLAGWGTR